MKLFTSYLKKQTAAESIEMVTKCSFSSGGDVALFLSKNKEAILDLIASEYSFTDAVISVFTKVV